MTRHPNGIEKPNKKVRSFVCSLAKLGGNSIQYEIKPIKVRIGPNTFKTELKVCSRSSNSATAPTYSTCNYCSKRFIKYHHDFALCKLQGIRKDAYFYAYGRTTEAYITNQLAYKINEALHWSFSSEIAKEARNRFERQAVKYRYDEQLRKFKEEQSHRSFLCNSRKLRLETELVNRTRDLTIQRAPARPRNPFPKNLGNLCQASSSTTSTRATFSE